MKQVEEKSVSSSAPLSDAERTRLQALEVEIETGAKAFMSVGDALREIRNTRLYRGTHKRFESYIEERFGFQRGHAYNLIASVDAVDTLAEAKLTLPANEYQVRPLAKLSAENQVKAWEMALCTADTGKVTHDIVKAAVDELEGRKEPVSFTDAPLFGPVDIGAAVNYWKGGVEENIAMLDPQSVDLLILSELGSEGFPEAAADLDATLTAIEATLKADCQALMFCPDHDYRALQTIVESHGFEVGVPVFRDRCHPQDTLEFSFLDSVEVILHLRRGKAKLHNPIQNLISVEDYRGEHPVALFMELIASAVPPGAVVLDPRASFATSVIACYRTGHLCFGFDPNFHDLGQCRLGIRALRTDLEASHG